MRFLEKLRSLPEPQRKAILWVVTGVVALVVFGWWAKSVRVRLQSFPTEGVKQHFQLPELPNLEIPEVEFSAISEEELKQLEEQLKEVENAEQQ